MLFRSLVSSVHSEKISPEGVLTFQEEEARNLFQEGKAVFMRNWPYAWNLVNAEGSPVKGKVGIMPMVGATPGAGAATLWYHRWRLFFLACEELFGFRNGSEWMVAHYRFAPVAAGTSAHDVATAGVP